MQRQASLIIFGVIFTCILAITQVGCSKTEPIRIGFSGQLSGAYADLGIKGRDGVLLAVEKINAADGIAGRPIKLLVRDDKGTPEGARAADKELIDAGVVAIIGHMTSGQSMAALPVVEKAGMVLLSPTTSAPSLTGRKDHFFRVIPDSSSEARLQARHVIYGAKLKRMAAIYDKDNAAYTSAYLKAFRDELQKLGGKLVGEVGYSSAKKPVFGPLVAQLRDAAPQGLLIIASAYDGAIIAQQPRLIGWQTHLFGCAWTMSQPLIENGGKAIEGMGFVFSYDLNSQTPAFLKFQRRYQSRFKETPSFMSGWSYEAMLILAAALEKTRGRAEGLINALPGIRIEGLMESISLDQHGDGVRTHYQINVKNGQFVTKGQLEQ